MLSIYSFKRRAILPVSVIFATLVLAMTAPSANAQEVNTIVQVRAALSHTTFQIDTRGCGYGPYESELQLRVLDDGVTLEGRYYLASAAPPADNNVHGTITFERRSGFGPVTRVSFEVSGRSGDAGIVIGGMHFEGAMRFRRNRDVKGGKPRAPWIFMAGTFTNTVPDGSQAQVGPYPFFAQD